MAPTNNDSSPTASSPSTACATKRKRLSRKERKQQKKQKSGHSTAAAATAPEASNRHDVRVAAVDEDVDYLANYVPTPMSKALKITAKTSSLGKWFPKGRILKPANPPPIHNTNSAPQIESSLVLFYQYLPPSKLWSTSRVDALMDYLQSVFEHLHQGLGGRIRVAREGVNATISAISTSEMSSAHRIRHFAQDLIQFDPNFQETDFKFIDHLLADRHFKDLKILPVQELVFYGGTTAGETSNEQQQDSSTIPGKFVDGDTKEDGAKHVDAVEFHRLLQEDDAVVIDVRNHYEAAIGRFAPPPVAVAATKPAPESDDEDEDDDDDDHNKAKHKQVQQREKYIDPKMRKSTDWIPWLQQPSTQEQLRNKKVLMYCTGGIRCEKASVYLEQAVGKEVQGIYQLKGGIERYMKTFADQGGGFWKGHNFVFDKREAVSSDQPQGVGGVYRKPEGKDAASKAVLPTMYCCLCEKPWDRYLGKKKCDTCGVPVLMCDTCLTHHSAKKKKHASGDEAASASNMKLARCPLCVEENITVPAALVEFTDNGKKIGKWVDPSDAEGGGGSMIAPSVESAKKTKSTENADPVPTQKVAPSVLKWGGGHASEKKVKRQMKRKQCRFGADCVRTDCFFAHPEREATSSAKAT